MPELDEATPATEQPQEQTKESSTNTIIAPAHVEIDITSGTVTVEGEVMDPETVGGPREPGTNYPRGHFYDHANNKWLKLPPDSVVFPPHVMQKGLLGELSRLLAQGNEVPQEAFFAAALTIFGAICATRELTLDVGLEVETRFYTPILGPTDVKKSDSIKRTVDFFKSLASGLCILTGVGSGEGLARKFRTERNILLIYDEFKAFVDKCRIQNASLLPMVTSLYHNHDWDNPTKDQDQPVRDARLSLLGACTLETYGKMWSSDATDIGFLNRLFVVAVNRRERVSYPEASNETALASLKKRFEDVLKDLPVREDLNDNRQPVILKMDVDAKGMWDHWYQNKPDTEYTKRLDTIGFRLMPLLALSVGKKSIDLEIVADVLVILDYELRVRKLTSPIDAENIVARLEQGIRRALENGPRTVRDVKTRVNADKCGLYFFDQALKNLVAHGEVGERQGKRRDSKVLYKVQYTYESDLSPADSASYDSIAS